MRGIKIKRKTPFSNPHINMLSLAVAVAAADAVPNKSKNAL